MVKKFIKKGVVLVTALAIMLSCVPAFAATNGEILLWSADFDSYNQTTETSKLTGWTVKGGSSKFSSAEVNGRKTLKINKNSSNLQLYQETAWQKQSEGSEAVHIETAIMRTSLNSDVTMYLMSNWGNNFGNVTLDGDGYIYINGTKTAYAYETNTWYNIDVYVNPVEKAMEVRINGGKLMEARYFCTTSLATTTSVNRVRYYYINSTTSTAEDIIYVDYINVYSSGYKGYTLTDSSVTPATTAPSFVSYTQDFDNYTDVTGTTVPTGMEYLNSDVSSGAMATAATYDGRKSLRLYDKNSQKNIGVGFAGWSKLPDIVIFETAVNITSIGTSDKDLEYIAGTPIVRFGKNGKIGSTNYTYETDTWYTVRSVVVKSTNSVTTYISGGEYDSLKLTGTLKGTAGRMLWAFRNPGKTDTSEMYIDYFNVYGFDADTLNFFTSAEKNEYVCSDSKVNLVFSENVTASAENFDVFVDDVKTTDFSATVKENVVTIASTSADGFGAGKTVKIRLNGVKDASENAFYGRTVYFKTTTDSLGEWKMYKNNAETNELVEGTVNFKRTISYKDSTKRDLICAVATYSSDGMEKIVFKKVPVSGIKTLSLDLDVLASETEDEYKVFLWDTNLVPID